MQVGSQKKKKEKQVFLNFLLNKSSRFKEFQ
jgi:hypothetical protein